MNGSLQPPVRHPWLLSIGVALAWRLVIYATAFALPTLAPAAFPQLGGVVVNAAACLVPLVVIGWLGWWREPWLTRVRPATWWPLLPLLLLYPIELAFGWEPGLGESLSILVLVMVAATSEELYARGVIQELLRAVPPIPRAVGVGLIFGLGHLLSGAVFGTDPAYLAFQIPHAVIQGFTLAAIRMHVVSIWPLVLLHALSNYMVLTSPPGAVPDWWEGLKLAIILVTGIVLVRRAERVWRHRAVDAAR